MRQALGIWLSLFSLLIAIACPVLNAELAREVYVDFDDTPSEITDFSAQQERLPDNLDVDSDMGYLLTVRGAQFFFFPFEEPLVSKDLAIPLLSLAPPLERPPRA